MNYCGKVLRATVLVLSVGIGPLLVAVAEESRPRLLVLTDIGGDPDDQQSLIRLMLYSNEFQIEGLIATASGTPGELKEAVTRPDLVRQIVEAYGQVQPSLVRHAKGYPPAASLLSLIKTGNSHRGLEQIGEGHDTEGSNWILSVADQRDPRPLNITIWGGQTDFAQALWRARHDRGEEGLRQLLARLRVYDIDDQDRIQTWIFENFPDLFYVLAKSRPGRDKREGAYRGMYLGGEESLTSLQWLDEHVRKNHGPLGALYPPETWTEPNPHGALKEGDTPSWFYFRPIALHDPAHPEFGGWGGRFERAQRGLWRDVPDTIDGQSDVRASVWRWRPFFQNEFRARMDWCRHEFAGANHTPEVMIRQGRSLATLSTKGGEPLRIAAHASDPDGNKLTYRWWLYADAGTYAGPVNLENDAAPEVTVDVPAGAAGKSLHLILEVTDDGVPPLTALHRVVLRVE